MGMRYYFVCCFLTENYVFGTAVLNNRDIILVNLTFQEVLVTQVLVSQLQEIEELYLQMKYQVCYIELRT